jgi:DNA-binding response OmpR family regulator
VADLELDTKALQARRGGRDIPLSATEFRLLEHLVRHAGEVQSKERVSRAMWHDGAVPDSNVLEVYVSKLRRKIDDGFAVRLIHTRRGSGYLLAAESR